MRTRFLLVFLMTALLVLVLPAVAQDAIPVEVGSAVQGSITSGSQTISYSVQAEAGQSLMLALVMDNYDLYPTLRLFGPGGALLGENNGNYFNLIVTEPLETAGTYIVAVGGSGTTGDFTLSVQQGLAQPFTGQVSGRLPHSGAMESYTLDMQAGDAFLFYARGPRLGLLMLAPQGEFLYSGGLYDDPVTPLLIAPQDGTYTLVLLLEAPEAADYFVWGGPQPVTQLTPGESISGQLIGGQPSIFVFDSLAFKAWQVEAQVDGPGGDSFIQILDPINREYWDSVVAADYGSGPGGIPRIGSFITPADGSYYVLLDFYTYGGPQTTRSYTLTLRPDTVLSLAPGVEISDEVNEQTGDLVYLYPGKAGEVIRLTLTQSGGVGRPGLVMRGEYEELVYFLGYRAQAASFELLLPEDGMYRVTVMNTEYYEPDSAVAFTLLLEQIEP